MILPHLVFPALTIARKDDIGWLPELGGSGKNVFLLQKESRKMSSAQRRYIDLCNQVLML